jgi:hypothetical protein
MAEYPVGTEGAVGGGGGDEGGGDEGGGGAGCLMYVFIPVPGADLLFAGMSVL